MGLIDKQGLQDKVGELPSLSAAIMDAIRTIDSGDFDFKLLEQKVIRDPGIAARTLRVANSAFYGFSGQVASLKEAFMVLGVLVVKNMLLSAAVVEALPANKHSRIDQKVLWHHAMAVGAAARLLAKHCGADPEQAFTAGLFHDLGRVFLNSFYPAEYHQVLAHRDAQGCRLRQAEEELLGFDHTLPGVLAARYWKLPAHLCDAIEHHHDPEHVADGGLVDIVHLADVLCHSLDIGSHDPNLPVLSEPAYARLGLACDRIGGLLIEVEEMNREAGPLPD